MQRGADRIYEISLVLNCFSSVLSNIVILTGKLPLLSCNLRIIKKNAKT